MINNTTIRFSGLASGMDTESIVKQLVDTQKGRLVKLQQAKTINMWKTDTYREINSKLVSFRNAIQDLRLQTTFNKQTTSVTSFDKVEATVAGSPSTSSFTISEAKLATSSHAATVSFKLGITAGEPVGQDISFELNGQNIIINSADTISSTITKINSAGAGVIASYFKDGSSLILTSETKASNSQIQLSGLTVNNNMVATTNNLGVVNGSISGNQDGSTLDTFSQNTGVSASSGADAVAAKIVINGLAINPTGNSFTFDGIKYNLKSDVLPGQPITVEVKKDTQAVFDNIKSFVEKYNELIKDLDTTITEKRHRDFSPLTDEQKSEMKDREIELWEEKAKSGLLNGDQSVSALLNELRTSLMTPVETSEGLKYLSDIGITTSKDWRENGKLEINETKLKAAIESNPENVMAIFTASSTQSGNTVTNSQKHDESGIGQRFYERLDEGISDLSKRAGYLHSSVDVNSVLAKELKNIDNSILREEERVRQVEGRYWRQFQAMEVAMQRANAQSGWLMQQFGGGV